MPSRGATASGDAAKIPDKLYFRIGEVSQIAGVEPHVLRFWETEFARLSPRKSGTGQRFYRRKDVEMVLELKRLLYEKRFTIEGARLCLEQERKKKAPLPPPPPAAQASLFGPDSAGVDRAGMEAIRRELAEILALLS